MILQLIACNKWKLAIADVEGAFLQGDDWNRKKGKIYAYPPPGGGVPGIVEDEECIIEISKCVYGLMDAPRQWWMSISFTLRNLGMKQSELDPCLFYWHQDDMLQGVIALHVDDMVISGTDNFTNIINALKMKYPFKRWKMGKGEFLGRLLEQQDDFSIMVSQTDYAKKVQTAKISKERRRLKDEPLTSTELKQYRAILGAAN